MDKTLVVILLTQWAVIVLMALALLGVARQVGVLHRRIGPAGALMTSTAAKVGEKSREFQLTTVDGREIFVGSPNIANRSTLIAFVAPDCPVCASLMPIYKSIAASEKSRLELLFVSDEAIGGHEIYRKRMGIDDYPYVLSTELGMSFEIGKLPYAVLLDENGVISSQGLVNSREHIESLLEAQRLKLDSIQAFFEATPNGGKLQAEI
jgi:methylamine dehydrogenase accessory protein MauD